MENNIVKCRRCQTPESYIILDKIHPECRPCFLESCNKKIRSAIGKSHLVRNNDAILISYSGGPSSCALLDLVRNSICSTNTRREQKFRPSILHIDVQSVSQANQHASEFLLDRRKNLEELLNSIYNTHPTWPIYWTTIETSLVEKPSLPTFVKFTGSCDNGTHLLSNDDAHMALQQALRDSGDMTDRQKFVTDKCSEHIVRTANTINLTLNEPRDKLKFIFTGSSATQLANDLMVDVILGRGATIRSKVSFCDNSQLVPVLRPMRDFSKKEVAYYLQARQISPPVQFNLLTKQDRCSSIQKLTESLLAKLYLDYPSTYNTLLKTGNKMQD